ncbi:MAG: AmmeMemoRadiSam system protein B [Nitrospirota bacterium]
MRREPAVAGSFYSISPSALTEEVRGYIQEDIDKKEAIAAISPHAGFIYSGRVAGAVYSRIKLPELIILVGPNHTGRGHDVSVFSQAIWQMPNGQISIDEEFCSFLIERSEFAEIDTGAHIYEHSLEVQLPFIQYFNQNFKIVPIIMRNNEIDVCHDLGEAIAGIVSESKKTALIIASSDMTHYEPDSDVREKDELAIDKMLQLDPEGLHNLIREKGISMCGYAPAAAVLFAALKLQAKETELVMYMTSGEINKDFDRVVGYAGIIIS